MNTGRIPYIAAMTALLVSLLPNPASAHNPWGVEALYTYSFRYSFGASIIISAIIVLFLVALQVRDGKRLNCIETAAAICTAIGGGSLILGVAFWLLVYLSQAFYLNYMMYILCVTLQAAGSVLGVSALYFTALQGRKLCLIEIAVILLSALGGFRLFAKFISVIIAQPPDGNGSQMVLLIGCFIPGALAAGLAVIQGRRKTLGVKPGIAQERADDGHTN